MSQAKELLPADAVELADFQKVILLDSVGSTNDYARALLTQPDVLTRRSLGELAVVATADQISGHGRLDRSWTAPRGAGLATSFIIRPHANPATRIKPENFHWFTLLLALAALDTLNQLGLKASLKWPNDVLVEDQKICGILAQLVAEAEGNFSVVAGIGMNLNFVAGQLPTETSTSVLVETGEETDCALALSLLGKNFARRYRNFAAVQADPGAEQKNGKSLLEEIRQCMGTLGQQVTLHLPGNEKVLGCAVDINEEGEIIVRDEEGQEKAYAVGDIVHLRSLKAEL